jgi:hypothetical protein
MSIKQSNIPVLVDVATSSVGRGVAIYPTVPDVTGIGVDFAVPSRELNEPVHEGRWPTCGIYRAVQQYIQRYA